MGGTVAYVEVRSDPDATTLPLAEPSEKQNALSDDSVPRVEVDQPHFDFGTMERGMTKSHEFLIRNVGSAPLRLKVGQTSCKCTLGKVTGDAIPPGGSTQVELEWSAKSDSGPFRQTATVQTNDPIQSQVELTVEGQIVDATGVMPPDLMFDKIAAGESKAAEVYVMAMLQDELTVSSAELSDPATRDKFDVRIEPVQRDALPNKLAKGGVRITVTAKPGLPIGRFDQWLSLRTNLPGEKLEIPVIGRVVGDISMHGVVGWIEEQGVLVIGKVKSDKGTKSRVNVLVRGRDAANVKLDVKSVDPPELKINIGEPKQIKPELLHIPVEIEVPAGTRPMVRLNTAQGEEARIVLSTTHPTIKELMLGVRFAVER